MISYRTFKFYTMKILGLDIHYPIKKINRKKVIFIHIPKTAGTSISNLLGFFSKKHYTARQVIDKVGNLWDKSFKFTVVRDPYERVLSMYYEYLRVNKIPIADRGKKFSFENWVINCFQEKNEDYLKWKPFFFTQKKWLENHSGEINMDYIARFENLEREMNLISNIIGLKGELPKLNKSSSKKEYEFHRTETTDKIIENYFSDDFEYFGYKKNNK